MPGKNANRPPNLRPLQGGLPTQPPPSPQAAETPRPPGTRLLLLTKCRVDALSLTNLDRRIGMSGP